MNPFFDIAPDIALAFQTGGSHVADFAEYVRSNQTRSCKPKIQAIPALELGSRPSKVRATR
jgi:hypothetical protein